MSWRARRPSTPIGKTACASWTASSTAASTATSCHGRTSRLWSTRPSAPTTAKTTCTASQTASSPCRTTSTPRAASGASRSGCRSGSATSLWRTRGRARSRRPRWSTCWPTTTASAAGANCRRSEATAPADEAGGRVKRTGGVLAEHAPRPLLHAEVVLDPAVRGQAVAERLEDDLQAAGRSREAIDAGDDLLRLVRHVVAELRELLGAHREIGRQRPRHARDPDAVLQQPPRLDGKEAGGRADDREAAETDREQKKTVGVHGFSLPRSWRRRQTGGAERGRRGRHERGRLKPCIPTVFFCSRSVSAA